MSPPGPPLLHLVDSLDVHDHLHYHATTTSLILLTTSSFHLTTLSSPPNGITTTRVIPYLDLAEHLNDDHLYFTSFAMQSHRELLLLLPKHVPVHEHLAKPDATMPSTSLLRAPLAKAAPSTIMMPR